MKLRSRNDSQQINETNNDNKHFHHSIIIPQSKKKTKMDQPPLKTQSEHTN